MNSKTNQELDSVFVMVFEFTTAVSLHRATKLASHKVTSSHQRSVLSSICELLPKHLKKGKYLTTRSINLYGVATSGRQPGRAHIVVATIYEYRKPRSFNRIRLETIVVRCYKVLFRSKCRDATTFRMGVEIGD